MRGHSNAPGRLVVARCEICGGVVTPDFAFDMSEWEDGSKWAHPSCFAYTHSDSTGTPSRKLKKGQRVVQTCGNGLCLNPKHLKAVW